MATLIREGGQWVIRSDWDEDDVRGQTDEDLTDEQVEKIMRLIVDTHDACIGINWDVIDSAIDEVLGE
jgi:DNA gyrase/topoisomerase IV subunit B